MAVGKVKFFNTQKGFGFIQPDDGSRDVFVHISAVEKAGLGTLEEGEKISYELVTERGKQAAGNLTRAGDRRNFVDRRPAPQAPGVSIQPASRTC